MATVKKNCICPISIPDFSKGFPMKKCKKEALTKVEIESVGSVQMTEKDCIISLKDLKTQETLITECISLRDRTVQFLDVEKTITNVTIKDVSYELENCYIATQMLKYGEVIPGSELRSYMQDTLVENGLRYLQILNCISTLPNRTKFVRFEVLVFAVNNRTECIHCSKNTHPSYSYRHKPIFKKSVLTVQGISLGIVRICSYCKNK